jgi:hypothetical protein
MAITADPDIEMLELSERERLEDTRGLSAVFLTFEQRLAFSDIATYPDNMFISRQSTVEVMRATTEPPNRWLPCPRVSRGARICQGVLVRLETIFGGGAAWFIVGVSADVIKTDNLRHLHNFQWHHYSLPRDSFRGVTSAVLRGLDRSPVPRDRETAAALNRFLMGILGCWVEGREAPDNSGAGLRILSAPDYTAFLGGGLAHMHIDFEPPRVCGGTGVVGTQMFGSELEVSWSFLESSRG